MFQSTGSEIAVEGLRRNAAFYAVEADIRSATSESRLTNRRSRTAPQVEEFGARSRKQRVRVSAWSHLGKALDYSARHWDGLQIFLDDGRVELDNNAVDNRISPRPGQERTRCSPLTTKARPAGGGWTRR